MTLSSAFSIANQSLGTISSQISVVSQNVSGANTTGYSTKTTNVITGADGSAQMSGVSRIANLALQKSSLAASSQQAADAAISAGLDQIDQSLNISSSSASSTTSSTTPADMIANLASSLQTLATTPNSASAAQGVVFSAQSVAQSLNAATTATQNVRAQADASIGTAVNTVNQLLGQFQTVNNAIVAGSATGADVTTALDQRDQLVSQISQYMGVSTLVGPNNSMSLYTDSGVTLFDTTPRAVSFTPTSQFSATTTGNSVSIGGIPVTGASAGAMALQSGSIAGLTQLRDVIAPQFQAQLDETARGLIVNFANAENASGVGVSPGLFTTNPATDANSAVAANPPAIIAGLAGEISVNPNAVNNPGVLMSAGGISSNTASASGSLAYAQQLQDALSNPTSLYSVTGNGVGVADTSTSASLAPATGVSVQSYATNSVGWFEAQRQSADNSSTYQSALMTQTQQALSSATGVNLDAQMSQMLTLENSYQASAKLLATINDIYTTLFTTLQPQAQP